MSDSEDSIDENIEETVGQQQPETEESYDRKTLPKHMKQRYWNSLEEMRLIELWRIHFNEVIDLEKNHAIFRTIGAGLRESGYHMYAQDVRRKMKTTYNRYLTEHRRLKEEGGKSDWRLYQLMHCMMNSKRPNIDVHLKEKTLAAIQEENKSQTLYKIFASGMPVNETLKRIEAGEDVDIPEPQPASTKICFPIENKTVAASLICAYQNKHKSSYTPRVFRHEYELEQRAKQFNAILESLSTNNVIVHNVAASTPPLSLQPQPTSPTKAYPLASAMNQLKRGNKFFNGQGILKAKVSEIALEKIRAENRQLMEDVVIAAKKLRQEEQQLKSYEHMMKDVKNFYEKILKDLDFSKNLTN